jgi:hypothetical protein
VELPSTAFSQQVVATLFDQCPDLVDLVWRRDGWGSCDMLIPRMTPFLSYVRTLRLHEVKDDIVLRR